MAIISANSLSYLNQIVNILPETECSNTLKSYYYTRCRLLEIRDSITYSKGARCTKCFTYYSDSKKVCQLEPEKKMSRFARRLLLKCAMNKPLTKYQIKYKKEMKQTTGNRLISICEICKTQAKQYFKKPKKLSSLQVETPAIQTKKKKKRKDKFSGLNKQAVLSAFKDKCSVKVPINPTKNIDSTVSNLISKNVKNNDKSVSKLKKKNMYSEQIKFQKQKKKNENNLLKVNSMLQRSEAQKNTNTLQQFLKNL